MNANQIDPSFTCSVGIWPPVKASNVRPRGYDSTINQNMNFNAVPIEGKPNAGRV